MYLLQRACIKKAEQEVVGINSILRFEYMGAAEFEWGTLPRSLKKILRDLENFEIRQTKFVYNGKKLYIFAKKGEHDEIEKDLEDLLTSPRYITKEWTNIPEALGLRRPLGGECTTDFWWCVDNSSFGTNNDHPDWMMFLSNKAFLKTFKKAIEAEAAKN